MRKPDVLVPHKMRGNKKMSIVKRKFHITLLIVAALTFSWFPYTSAQEDHNIIQLTNGPAIECFPSWSPDNKSLVYSYISQDKISDKTGLWIISADSSTKKQICFEIAEHPQWSPDGKFIIFDADSGRNVKMINSSGGNPINVLPDYIHINKGGLPCWSPDGNKFAFKDENYAIWIKELISDSLTRIYHKEDVISLPTCWTPDGKSILIAEMKKTTRNSTIRKISADGRQDNQIEGHHIGFYRYISISPDGLLLIYTAKAGKYLGLWVIPAEGGKTIPLMESESGHTESPCWSPDGRKIAFTGSRNGNIDVYIMYTEPDQIKKELHLTE